MGQAGGDAPSLPHAGSRVGCPGSASGRRRPGRSLGLRGSQSGPREPRTPSRASRLPAMRSEARPRAAREPRSGSAALQTMRRGTRETVFVFGSGKGGVGGFGGPQTTPPSPALGAEEPGGGKCGARARTQPDLPRGRDGTRLLPTPSLELRSVNKPGSAPSPRLLGPGLKARRSPVPPVRSELPWFSALCRSLRPCHTPSARDPSPPPPGWLGHDLIRGRLGGRGSGRVGGTRTRKARAGRRNRTGHLHHSARTARAPDPRGCPPQGECLGVPRRRGAEDRSVFLPGSGSPTGSRRPLGLQRLPPQLVPAESPLAAQSLLTSRGARRPVAPRVAGCSGRPGSGENGPPRT